MTIWMVCGVGVAAALLSLTLRRLHPEQATAVALAAGCVTAIAICTTALPIISEIRALLDSMPVIQQYGSILLKALAIALLTQTVADICRDAGESALAGHTELAGKTLLAAAALPLFKDVLSMIAAILQNGEAAP